jgi:replicative DNA helicase
MVTQGGSVKDVSDRQREGTLAKSPAEESTAITADLAVRKATLRIVDEQIDTADLPMPSDVHAESAILAALLWAGTYAPGTLHVGSIRDLVTGEAFFTPAHRAIFEAIVERDRLSQPVDSVSVHSTLVERGRSRVANGIEYVEQLVATSLPCSEIQLRGYAESVRDAWVRRRLIIAARAVERLAKSGKLKAHDATQKSISMLDELASSVVTTASLVTSKAAVERVKHRLSSGRTGAMDTSVAGFTKYLGGVWPKEVTIVAARTSVGKSAFVNMLMQDVVDRNPGVGAVYVTLEMPAEDFVIRTASADAKVDAEKALRQLMGKEERDAFNEALESLERKPIMFVDAEVQTCMSVMGILQQAAKTFATQGLRLGVVAIDHIHLLKPPDERMPREQFMATVSRWLKFLSTRLNCSVVALAQISRESERQTGDRTPKMHMIRESGAIEQDADNVVLIHRRRDKQNMFIDEPAKIIIAKARKHRTGIFSMSVDQQFCLFSNFNQMARAPEPDRQHVAQPGGYSTYQFASGQHPEDEQ